MITLPDRWQIRLIQLLTIPGLLVSFFLYLYHEGRLIGVCNPSGWDDCGLVSGPDAPYSAIGPIPVALIGLIGFALIFLITWLPDWVPTLEDYLPEILTGTIGLAFIFIIGLTALELFVIHAVCRYCLIAAAIVIIMFILAINYLRQVSRPKPTRQENQDET